MAHEGSFIGRNDTVFNYEVVDWRRTDDDKKVGNADNIITSQAAEVTVQVENDDTGAIDYQTITGPFDDWEYVDYTLEIDWGDDGTRLSGQ